MTDWIKKVPLDQSIPSDDTEQSPLRQVLYGPRNSQQNHHQQQQQQSLKIQGPYNHPFSVPAYLRNVCEHGRDITTNTWSGKILKELHHHLPDALPKIHYALCDIGDADFQTSFNSSLDKLLRHGAFGYKGFKFWILIILWIEIWSNYRLRIFCNTDNLKILNTFVSQI